MPNQDRRNGCLWALDPEQEKSYTDALRAGAVHTVLVTIGPCMQGSFPLAAVVRVDGVVTIRGGLDRGQDGKFIAMVHEQAEAYGPNVAIHSVTDKAGDFVVPCPPK